VIKSRIAVIIPVYNHEQKVRDVVLETLKLNCPVFVIDDGSTDETYNNIKDIERVTIVRHPINIGKGAAILTGFDKAVRIADWAITLDADGQHDPLDAIDMINKIQKNERPIIVGMRKGMKNKAPWTSRYGRKFSNFWVWVSGGPLINDSQSGFRLYPIPESIELDVRARRFQFEVEILVKAKRKNMPVVEVPVNVNYQKNTQRVSHFRPFIDFLRNSETYCRLIFQRLTVFCEK